MAQLRQLLAELGETAVHDPWRRWLECPESCVLAIQTFAERFDLPVGVSFRRQHCISTTRHP